MGQQPGDLHRVFTLDLEAEARVGAGALHEAQWMEGEARDQVPESPECPSVGHRSG